MEGRKHKIINYFIILQLLNFKKEEVNKIFNKYRDILDRDFVQSLFEFDKEDKFIVNKFSDYVKNTAEETFEKYNNNIIYYEDEIFGDNLRLIYNSPIVLFYKGNLNLLNSKRSLSIVGTRNPDKWAIEDTERITKFLIENNITIVSGLAKGIDATTHKFCMEKNYKNVIGVVATPLGKYYPKENKKIQEYIENNGLLITEYPFFEPTMKWNFLRRNYIMSAISHSTIVMQAGDTSGTVSQARSTLKNGKKLFVPAKVFDSKENSWPQKFKNDYGNVYRFEYLKDLVNLIKEEL